MATARKSPTSLTNFGLIVSAAAGLGAGAGCKQVDRSGVKTLDAVASGGITELYQCKGSHPVKLPESAVVFDRTAAVGKSGGDHRNLRSAVFDYFSALDPAMQQLFLDLGGQVMITDESRIAEYCNVSRSKGPEGQRTGDSTHGCYLFVDDPTGKKETVFTIVQSASAQNIRYFGPQIFGYLYAQFYSRLAPPTRQGAAFSISANEGMQFVTFKERLAEAFLGDILSSSKYGFNALTVILGESAEAELRATAKGSSLVSALSFRRSGESAKPDSATRERRRSQVLDYLFAHAYQSMNCSAKALAVTKSDFPKSFAAFEEINAGLLELSRQLAGGEVSSGYSRLALSGNQNGKLAKSGSINGGTDAAGDKLALNMDFKEIFGMLMPVISQLGIPGVDKIGEILPALLNGNGDISQLIPALQGLLTQTQLGKSGSLFDAVSNAGCQGGNCGGGNCNGGNCRGGNCSSCPQGVSGGGVDFVGPGPDAGAIQLINS
jgi:hypothetical protein